MHMPLEAPLPCAQMAPRTGGIWHPQIYSDPDPSPQLRGVASVVDVGVLTPTFSPVRGFKTHTFSADFCLNGSLQSLSFSGRSVSALAAALQLPPLPLSLLLLHQTWHRLRMWPADDWLFCLKSRLYCYVRFIVQLVLMTREIPNNTRVCICFNH